MKYTQEEFEKQVDKAYKILWEMYRPKGSTPLGSSCPWDSMQESLLLQMLNAIDDALGR